MMIKQIFKMIWNQRRLNGWIWMELLVVFVALWYLVDMFVVQLYSYTRPMGYDITNCWKLSFDVYPEDADEYVNAPPRLKPKGRRWPKSLNACVVHRRWIMLALLSTLHPIPVATPGHRSCPVQPTAASSKSNLIINISFLPNSMMYSASRAVRGNRLANC